MTCTIRAVLVVRNDGSFHAGKRPTPRSKPTLLKAECLTADLQTHPSLQGYGHNHPMTGRQQPNSNSIRQPMNTIRPLLLSLVAILGLVGCTSTRTVSMHAMRPAQLTFDRDVQTILIVDRSQYHDGTVGLLEGILTGEVLDQDRAGLQVMVRSLRDQLAYSNRFQTRVASEVLPGNSLTNVFPSPLEPAQVQALLAQYDADMALSIEIFDTDFIITDGYRMVKKTARENDQSTEIEVPEYFAEGVANMSVGIRLYDGPTGEVIDEELYPRSHSWQAKASSVQEAVLALIDKADAASYVSSQIGTDYAYRIAPMPVRINRSFFSKSKRIPEMELGARHADVGEWREAARVWESGLGGAAPKDAGRLSYNIAIAYEVLGEWESARDWAERAYVEFGLKDARDYVTQLDRRVRQEEVVAQQL